jgi:hypothetical protein
MTEDRPRLDNTTEALSVDRANQLEVGEGDNAESTRPLGRSKQGRSSKSLARKKQASLAKSKVAALTTRIANKLIENQVVSEVAKELAVSPEEAALIVQEYRLDQQVHQVVVDSLTQGAAAVRAIQKVQELADKGNMGALKLIIAFNKHLKANNALDPAKAGTVVYDNRKVNVFQQINERAQKNLSALDEGSDGSSRE